MLRQTVQDFTRIDSIRLD